jgi:hypothetical protein
MKELGTFRYEPAHQPFDAPVSFTLKPLDLRGQYEVQSSMSDGVPGWDGLVAASRYLVGWEGEPLGQFSRARVRQIVDGDADLHWMCWLAQITGKLLAESYLKDDASKKS